MTSDADVDDALAAETTAFEPSARPTDSTRLGAKTFNWRTLGETAAGSAWDALREWVEWFVVRYNVSDRIVPVCWYKHGELVEELSALHIAHGAAFDTSDTGFGPIGWHERRALAMSRLRDVYAGGCSRGHEDRIYRRSIGTVDEQDWAAWITESHAH